MHNNLRNFYVIIDIYAYADIFFLLKCGIPLRDLAHLSHLSAFWDPQYTFNFQSCDGLWDAALFSLFTHHFFHSWQKSTKNLSSIFNPKAWLFCGFSNHRHRIIVRDPSILRFNGRDDETECSKQFFCSDSHQKKTLQPKIVLRLWLHQIFLLDLCEPYNLSNM